MTTPRWIKLLVVGLGTALALYGCGGGGGTESVSNKVTVLSSGNGNFSIRGDAIKNVAGILLTLSYDPAYLSNPTVTEGDLFTGFYPEFYTGLVGTIRIAYVSTNGVSGSGTIASISFANYSGNRKPALTSVQLVSPDGKTY